MATITSPHFCPTVRICETGCMDETELTSEYTSQIPAPRVVTTAFQEDVSLDFMHRWAQQLSMVPVQNVEPTCVLAGDSMAIEWIMLIPSDLCRQVMHYPTMTMCDICMHTLGDTALDKHRDARSWREVNGHIMRLPPLAFRQIKSHQHDPPPESFAALCWAGNARADQMVPRQLQQRPPLSPALEQELTPWKRFLVLNALIAAVRYTDTTDTDAPEQLAWEHGPRQPTSDKGPWPK
eukprot:6491017-Amphidinium_carterae.2